MSRLRQLHTVLSINEIFSHTLRVIFHPYTLSRTPLPDPSERRLVVEGRLLASDDNVAAGELSSRCTIAWEEGGEALSQATRPPARRGP